MVVDVGQLIRQHVLDRDGHSLPGTITSGAYQLRELGDDRQVALYEGKVITDKTLGHATYGCMICCGYQGGSGSFLLEDPTNVAIADRSSVDVYAQNQCTGSAEQVTSYFPNWSTYNTSVMTAQYAEVQGINDGSTLIAVSGPRLPSGDGEDTPGHGSTPRACPVAPASSSGQGNVQQPDHIVSLSDGTETLSCPGGYTQLSRTVNYSVLTAGQQTVTQLTSVYETVNPNTTSSCTNSVISTTTSCSQITNGNIFDTLNAGCPGFSNPGCGFTCPSQFLDSLPNYWKQESGDNWAGYSPEQFDQPWRQH